MVRPRTYRKRQRVDRIVHHCSVLNKEEDRCCSIRYIADTDGIRWKVVHLHRGFRFLRESASVVRMSPRAVEIEEFGSNLCNVCSTSGRHLQNLGSIGLLKV